jgi:hypothetical protein
MLELCLRTLRSGTGSGARGAVAVPVTLHTTDSVHGALDAYASTVAAAKMLLGAVPADDERAAFGECMVGYGRAPRGHGARRLQHHPLHPRSRLPAEKLACYLSNDGGALLTFEALAEIASFTRTWVPFCRKHNSISEE